MDEVGGDEEEVDAESEENEDTGEGEPRDSKEERVGRSAGARDGY